MIKLRVVEQDQAILKPAAGDTVKLLADDRLAFIPDGCAIVNGVTAEAADVKAGKKIVLPSGEEATGTYVWDWRGDKAEKLADIYSTSFTLGSTAFNGWTPSTSAKSIKSSVTLSSAEFSADLTQYEYLMHWRCQFVAAYNSGATKKVQIHTEIAEIWQAIYRRPSTLPNMAAENYSTAVCSTLHTAPLLVYYNSSGTLTPYFSISYGIYPSATSPAFSSTSSDTPTITPKSPSYNARCNASYFATARASELDQTNSIIKMTGELYRIPIRSTTRRIYEGLTNLYNHPL